MESSEHAIAGEIMGELGRHGFWYEAFSHQPVRTSEEAAAMRDGYTLQQGAKAIIVRVKIRGGGRKFLMLVMPADQKLDSRKVKQNLDAKDMRFATEEEVIMATDGVKPGGVPPFGNLFKLAVVADPLLFENDKIVFNAGRNFSIAMMSSDYKTLVEPTIASIV